jgi:hypothetical protein
VFVCVCPFLFRCREARQVCKLCSASDVGRKQNKPKNGQSTFGTCMLLQNWTKYICTSLLLGAYSAVLQAKFQKQTMPRVEAPGVNSAKCRMSGAHAPRSAIPHMSRPGCEPARCVHWAASGSRRQGVVGVDYPDADSCPRRVSRTHARTGGRRANGVARLPLVVLQAASSLPSSRRHLEADGRSEWHSGFPHESPAAAVGSAPGLSFATEYQARTST